MTKVVTIVGARPQFVKAAPVSRALAAGGFDEVLIHTGQHFDPEMSEVFFSDLALRAPTHDLGISGGGHGEMTGRMLVAIERTLMEERPAAVMVFGDTNSTLAGALAAAKLHLPLAHVEAGLRSFNRSMPEEVNRVLTDHASSLLLCPTATAMANLTAEGLVERAVQVGDVMYDVAIDAAERARESTVLERLGVTDGSYAVATIHRAENTDDDRRLEGVVKYLKGQDEHVVLPLHPRTRDAAGRWGIDLGSIQQVAPLGFLDMTRLVQGATRVFTDSGGLQKEAYFHRIPCVTLRDETEWVETVEAGWNRLWTVEDYAPRQDIADYGDGHAAEAIVHALSEHIGS
ncbi:MAG: UDP-N-acetylglucosamine 2-epimerase (non-hydrolyzing) [Acidimicrobiia bacterium]|nr:UDP-N-acetylglucosamine 2-epimerase (non-hydrolyzing) [Acidimicrobiia bacterium]